MASTLGGKINASLSDSLIQWRGVALPLSHEDAASEWVLFSDRRAKRR